MRHKAAHLPETLSLARDAAEVARGDGLLAQLCGLHDRTLAILTQAEEKGELRTALSAIREARGGIELASKLTGRLTEQHHHTLDPEMTRELTEMLRILNERFAGNPVRDIRNSPHLLEGAAALPRPVEWTGVERVLGDGTREHLP